MRVQGDSELTVLVDRLRRDRRRDPYSGQDSYSRTAREVADRCEKLIDVGEASVAVPLLRKAVDRMTGALMYMDSSSGVLGNDLAYLMEVYARACRAAPPRLAGLAAWLVKLVCDGPGWPDVVLREWAPALGPKGLAEVARLVDERAAETEPDDWHRQWAVRYLREQIVEVSGDVDRHVQVLAERLVSADQYGRIVTVLGQAQRPAEAIDWARRGLAAHPSGYQAVALRDLLVRLLIETGEPEAAVAERRTAFDVQPTIDNFRSLLATVAETDQDAAHTERALTVVRERAAGQAGYLLHLIDVLILAGRDNEAWCTGLARWDEVPARQRVELVELRRRTHPAEVCEPYQALIDAQLLDSYDKRRYDRAITLLRNLREAYVATGEVTRFEAYLEALRAEHRRRPTFLAKLDAARFQSGR
ncbi:tetratricopeptide repeat protein [Micromonospora sp. NPDC049903]|uniref:tetratricopeptide repeat protein n=1 Tax=Micromonospora sp. NPDC049903 TaxID=3364276 RepID=UPI0037969E97